jgi:hypothetical protein
MCSAGKLRRRAHLGLRLPMTVAVTGPDARPTRMITVPLLGSSSSMSVAAAACAPGRHAAAANLGIRTSIEQIRAHATFTP